MGKINANDFIEAAKSYCDHVVKDNWNGIEFEITTTIGMREMMDFVIDVVESCFTDDEVYLPEIKDYSMRANIILHYTNIELPDDVIQRYELLYATNIVDFVVSKINNTQLKEIYRSIDKKIEHRAAANIEMVYKQVNDLYIQMNNLFDKIGGAFNNVTEEEVQNVMKALANGSMDEAKIVKALSERQYKG